MSCLVEYHIQAHSTFKFINKVIYIVLYNNITVFTWHLVNAIEVNENLYVGLLFKNYILNLRLNKKWEIK